MNRLLVALVSPLLLALPLVANAQEISIQIDEAAANAVGINAADAEAALSNAADSTLKVGEQLAFMDQMARANALATRGMGVDYASNIEKFVFGLGFGSAVSGTGPQFSRGGIELPEGGYAGSLSFMGGLNVGMSAEEDSFARRIKLFAHGMYARPTYEPFQGTVINFGGHLQAQLARPKRGSVVEWGGLALTTGYQHTIFKMDLQDQIPIDTGDVRWDADGKYAIQAAAQSVPVEVSTNVRVLFATAYGGVGVDANIYSGAESELVLDGDIAASANDTVIGTATVSMEEAGAGDLIVPRIFMGLQANIFFVKAYGQVNIAFNESFGGHLGVRVAI